MRGRIENRLAITRVVQVSNNSCGPKNHLDLYLGHLDTPSKCLLTHLSHHRNQHQFVRHFYSYTTMQMRFALAKKLNGFLTVLKNDPKIN